MKPMRGNAHRLCHSGYLKIPEKGRSSHLSRVVDRHHRDYPTA
jgi:hypothetical protein